MLGAAVSAPILRITHIGLGEMMYSNQPMRKLEIFRNHPHGDFRFILERFEFGE